MDSDSIIEDTCSDFYSDASDSSNLMTYDKFF